MSLLELNISGLPISARSGQQALGDIHFDEFSTSPVDEVARAIAARPGIPQQAKQTARYLNLSSPAADIVDVSVIIRRLRENIEASWGAWAASQSPQSKSASQEGTGQLGLWISGDFSPSKRLTEIWVSGLLALGDDAGLATASAADFEVAQEFSHTLSALLGTIAHRLRFQRSADVEITRGAKFTPSYQIQICDAFLIIPDQAAEFLELLRGEIFHGVSAGCEISGAWGKVAASSEGELRFELSEPEFITDPNFEESEEIE